MAYRLFEGKKHAALYLKYRVSPSDHLIQQVLGFLEKQKGRPFELAVDVGCGSGQGTLLLAKHFASVVGTDVSPAQLELALQHAQQANITYRLCPDDRLLELIGRQGSRHTQCTQRTLRECVAEELPFADSSVDLVTAMTAFHWFDRPRFLQEAHRVLKPRGCLALLSYTMDIELSYRDCCAHTLNQVSQEAGVCVGETYHASVQLHGDAGVVLQLPDSAER
ncbi:putative methyltransferase DDB G0268948 isoform 4 [Scophthalmus maximus]|uniref:Putative methyltransferase DDB G0268948 isoform 4 n=1 Tax=Scophthalmus maximus TaxID=52904 RepID=A0A2U9C9X8_SCOMX|nr:putative methyltransferase DDB G0268948 isoform 4 [Scophthalmus maximus]